MYLKKKKKSGARSDLRTRLEEYTTWKEGSGWFPPEGKEGEEGDILRGILAVTSIKNMHRFLLGKIMAVCGILLVVYLLSFMKMPFTFALLGKINYITTWDMDFKAIGQQALPVARMMWEGNIEDGLGQKVVAPGVLRQNEEKGGEELLFLCPVEGELEKTFGLQDNSLLQREEMSYGLLFRPAQGALVRAAEDGVVQSIKEDPDYGLNLLLKHRLETETCYGYLAEVFVKEGESVSRGQDIAVVGFVPGEGGAALYFELREKGRPLDPQPLLVGSKGE
jgi:hypothetical protein